MEKISIQSTYTQVSLYARLSGPVSLKKPGADDGSDANAASGAPANALDPKSGECARSKDGDTFSLSIEARTLQISESITIESQGGKESAGANGASAKTDKASQQDRLTGGGLVNALMDALKTIADPVSQGKQAKGGKHHHHFPHLSDSDDVANQVLSRLDQDHAAKGGSKDDFAAEIKKRMGDWKSASATKVTVEYQEFRSEVHMKVSAGLDAWLGQGTSGDSAATAGTEPNTDAGAGTGPESQKLTEI